MQWATIIAIIAAVPVIVIPAAFIWYLNLGGIFQAMRKGMRKAERGVF